MTYILVLFVMSYHCENITSLKIPDFQTLEECKEWGEVIQKYRFKRFDVEYVCISQKLPQRPN
jgi:hypothetical protein